jgi:hypothetical protein
MPARARANHLAGRFAAVNPTYLAVAGRIRRELQELDQVVIRTVRIWQQRRSERLAARLRELGDDPDQY